MSRLTPSRLIAVIVAVALLGVAAIGAVGTADAANRAKTKVTIQAQTGGFFGNVKSKRDSCESDRKVVLYKRRKGKKRNRRKDRKIGSDIAQPNGPDGMWSINTDRQGRFYAYAKRTKQCKAAYSRSVKAEPPAEEETPQ
jgi:hypothetical protein